MRSHLRHTNGTAKSPPPTGFPAFLPLRPHFPFLLLIHWSGGRKDGGKEKKGGGDYLIRMWEVGGGGVTTCFLALLPMAPQSPFTTT